MKKACKVLGIVVAIVAIGMIVCKAAGGRCCCGGEGEDGCECECC